MRFLGLHLGQYFACDSMGLKNIGQDIIFCFHYLVLFFRVEEGCTVTQAGE